MSKPYLCGVLIDSNSDPFMFIYFSPSLKLPVRDPVLGTDTAALQDDYGSPEAKGRDLDEKSHGLLVGSWYNGSSASISLKH